jgi:hypothetical protein
MAISIMPVHKIRCNKPSRAKLRLSTSFQDILFFNFHNIALSKFHKILLQCSVPEGDLHCQCILSIFPASVHQFYANILVFVNINPFLYINDQFALVNIKPVSLHQRSICIEKCRPGFF